MIGLALVMSGVITQYPSPDHPAWDIACRTGRPVRAYHDGMMHSRTHPGLGNVVEIEGKEGRSLYAHLHSVVGPSREVKRGELIGQCGNTGSWTTGPHLHFEFTPRRNP